jgi:hypothetical protein
MLSPDRREEAMADCRPGWTRIRVDWGGEERWTVGDGEEGAVFVSLFFPLPLFFFFFALHSLLSHLFSNARRFLG